VAGLGSVQRSCLRAAHAAPALATVRRRKGGSDAWHDAVTLSSITRPVFLQPDPLMEGQFFSNVHMR